MAISCTACGRTERDDEARICSGCGVPFEESKGVPSGGAAAASPDVATETPAQPLPSKAKARKVKKAPEREASAAPSGPFCDRCRGESTDENAGDVSEGFLFGRSFWLSSFSARPCDTCGAEVRTLWHVFAGIPIVPIGSYRYKIAQGDIEHRRWKFFSRRLPALDRSQVATTRVVSLLLLAVVAAVIYWRSRR